MANGGQAQATANAAEQMTEDMARATMVVTHLRHAILIAHVFVTIRHTLVIRLHHRLGGMGMRRHSADRLPAEFRREHGEQQNDHQEAEHDAHEQENQRDQ